MKDRAQELCHELAAALNAAAVDGLAYDEIVAALAFTAGDILERNRERRTPLAHAQFARANAAQEFADLVESAMKHRAEKTAEGGA